MTRGTVDVDDGQKMYMDSTKACIVNEAMKGCGGAHSGRYLQATHNQNTNTNPS